MTIRELLRSEYPEAIELTLAVFNEFEAPFYSGDGLAVFGKAVNNEEYLDSLRIIGAFEQDVLTGIIALKEADTHIALFFVKKEFQNRGTGKQLFLKAVTYCRSDVMTVNSSVYALKIYEKLGFEPTADEQITDSIRYTPMSCVIRRADCPCKRNKCQRHSDCVACREHHKTEKSNSPVCFRTEKGAEKRRRR